MGGMGFSSLRKPPWLELSCALVSQMRSPRYCELVLMSVEIVVYEEGKEVERRDLEKDKYLVFTAHDWEISSFQAWPKSGTVQMTIKRTPV